MFKLMKKGVLVMALLLLSNLGKAQDVHFSQYYAMPIFHNPAMTGYMNGDVRVAADFRMQWESFGEGFGNAFRTAAVAADFGLLRSKTGGSTLGIGATFINDAAGDLSLKTNQAGLALSYVLVLDKDRTNYLGVGFHGTYTQKSIDFTNADFPDINENLFVPNFGNFNFAAGLIWFFQPSDDVNFYVGGALHNILNTKNSFTLGDNSIVDRRITAQFGSQFSISNKISLVPSILFQKQGPNQELVFGTFFKFGIGNQYGQSSGATSLQIGGFYRFADAIIPTVRIDYKPVSFIFSYDVNISKLTPASKTVGGPEISITYTGRMFPQSKHKDIKCPVL